MLDGKTILVVEAEFLIALDIQRMLEGMSADQLLFARSADEAHELGQHWDALGLAIVELRQHQPVSMALVQSLRDRDIPVVISSADGAIRQGHPDFPGVPVLVKPMAEDDLANAIRQILPVSP
ncbi:response regulator [Devosia sp. SL43]|uniref:response regulator n=1 Tax=Devosia sp. SL43 TaxID=2806348 RepID=UPI001F41C91B|nr:response regulator [Devosia sp. SL43]UJW87119.1 response regulator [Devosia sp. SL43]